jgi:hypothetical protein
MLTQAEWQARENELEALKAERKALKARNAEISKRIQVLSIDIAAYKKRQENPTPIRTDTFAYQMFGKQLKDLTQDECRIYYAARQRINRAKRKEKAQ